MNTLAQVPIGQTFGSPFGRNKFLGDLVSSGLNIVFAVAGVIIMLFFVIGGIQMIAGAGSDNPQEVAKGKQAVTSALIGFVIIFVAYWIIQIIEKITGVTFVTAPNL